MKRFFLVLVIGLSVILATANLPAEAGEAREWIATYSGPGGTAVGAHSFPKMLDRDTGTGIKSVGVVDTNGPLAEQGCLIDLTERGKIRNRTCFGGKRDDSITGLVLSGDGGYYLSGHTSSTRSPGPGRAWIAEIDSGGEVQWSRWFGPRFEDSGDGLISTYNLVSLLKSSDGGILAAGYFITGLAGKTPPRNFDPEEIELKGWLVKLSSGGEVIWQKGYGGRDRGAFTSANRTPDGGLILGGSTLSWGSRGPTEPSDLWIVKTDDSGRIEWQYRYDKEKGATPGTELGINVRPTEDGYIAASISSYAKENNTWVTKLGPEGGIKWSKTYGAREGKLTFPLISPIPAGGYLLNTMSYPGEMGQGDTWLLRLTEAGKILWQREFGGAGYDCLLGFEVTEDGYSVFGTTASLGEKRKGIIANYAGFGPLSLPESTELQVEKTSAGSQEVTVSRSEVSQGLTPVDIPNFSVELETNQVELTQRYLH